VSHDSWFVQCGLSVHQQHVTVDQVAIHFAAGLGAWGGEGRERVKNIGRVCVRLIYAEKNQDLPTATKTRYSVVNKAEDKMQRQSS
jgi:hypothetical protein